MQLYCLGLLLNHQMQNLDPSAHIKDKRPLIFNLIASLQLPSEEIRGEIMIVLYKLSILEGVDNFHDYCPKLLHLSLDTLLKTQSDEVRMHCVGIYTFLPTPFTNFCLWSFLIVHSLNVAMFCLACSALLTVLAQKQYLTYSVFTNDQHSSNSVDGDNFMHEAGLQPNDIPLIVLFAEAIKGPLLSSNTQLQISTLDLICHCLSFEGDTAKAVVVLIEQGIVDYVFEILRLSGDKGTEINSCIQVLHLLSTAEHPFSQRLVIGFHTLVPVLRYVAEVPFHPVQSHILKVIWICLSNCPGIISRSHVEELVIILAQIFERKTSGELGMLPETFILCCSIFVTILKSPISHGLSTLASSIQEASTMQMQFYLAFVALKNQ